MTNPLLDAALGYARSGIPVFPCREKKPLTKNGFKDATTDEKKIRDWWKTATDMQIATPTGAPSHLLSVDIDTPPAAKFLEELEAEYGTLPDTLHIRTSIGRRQIHFRVRDEIPTKCATAFRGVNGFDIRGDGGYIILPPSIHHKSGEPYRVLIDAPLAEAPRWLIEVLNERPSPANKNGNEPAGEKIPEGRRNSTLTSLAGAMQRKGMLEDAIVAALLIENRRCSPPLPEVEVQRIAKSVSRYPPEATAKPDLDTIEKVAMWESFADVEMKRIEWVWQERIPKGMLTLFSGNPDVGKSLVLVYIIARFTMALDYPDAPNTLPPGKVLMLIAEDGAEDIAKPRLIAAGADLSRVHYLKKFEIRQGAKHIERAFALDTDLDSLRQRILADREIGLIVCDTLPSYLGKADMIKEQSLRAVLLPIRDLCQELGVTFIGSGHFNKRTDVRIAHKTSGSIAMVGVPRASWLFGVSPDVPGEYLMLLGKCNVTKQRTGLSYRIESKIIGQEIEAPFVTWNDGAVAESADEMLMPKDGELPIDRAVKLVEEFLASGPRKSQDLVDAASKIRIGYRTVETARKSLGVFAYKVGKTWWMSLVEPPPSR